ncbi:hypothetical protein QW180_15235 [Vibrio sinaloensis]|nr:hypothetical protein [Vibrio sinaloensis]
MNSYKKQVADYCNEQIKSGDEVQVRELSGELPPSQDGTSFFWITPKSRAMSLKRASRVIVLRFVN